MGFVIKVAWNRFIINVISSVELWPQTALNDKTNLKGCLNSLQPLMSTLMLMSNIPDGGAWESGLFDKDSFVEVLGGWAQTVICGRARLGGIPVAVISPEVQPIEKVRYIWWLHMEISGNPPPPPNHMRLYRVIKAIVPP